MALGTLSADLSKTKEVTDLGLSASADLGDSLRYQRNVSVKENGFFTVNYLPFTIFRRRTLVEVANH